MKKAVEENKVEAAEEPKTVAPIETTEPQEAAKSEAPEEPTQPITDQPEDREAAIA